MKTTFVLNVFLKELGVAYVSTVFQFLLHTAVTSGRESNELDTARNISKEMMYSVYEHNGIFYAI